MDELVKPAIDVVNSGQVRLWPENYKRVYLNWMENIRPWTISRQLWWGHQIPVWYRGDERYVGTEPPEGDGWTRDPDVLDTWFSSGACSRSRRSAGPSETPALQAFYPTDALVTARDIIFLWVARMIMLGIEFTGQIPFTDVYVHSIIQAPDGRRMSKSLGTGIDPMDLIEGGPRPPVFAQAGQPAGDFPAYGADAVRWGLLAMSSTPGRQVLRGQGRPGPAADQQAVERVAPDPARGRGGRARRGHSAHRRGPVDPVAAGARQGRHVGADRALRLLARRARRCTTSSTASCATGTWSSSSRGFAPANPSWRARCCTCSPQTLALAHPIMPFVTEEIYSYVPGADGLLAGGDPGRAARRRPTIAGRGDAGATDRGGAGAAGVARLGRRASRRDASRAARGERRLRGHGRAPAAARAAVARRADDGELPVASVPIPGGAVEIFASRRARPGGRRAQARRAARAARSRDRARRAQAGKRRLRVQGAGGRRRRRARQAGPTARGARRRCDAAEDAERYLLSLELFGMRFGLDRMQRLMTALGHPQRRFRVDPRGRDQRQVLDSADDRRDPQAPRAAHRRVPVPAPGLVRRAHPDRRRRTSSRPRSPRPCSAPPTPPSSSIARWGPTTG